MTESILPTETTYYYIGNKDCKKATCNRKQEFPKADCPYCLGHSWSEWDYK